MSFGNYQNKRISLTCEGRTLCFIRGLSNTVYTRSDGVIVIPITALKD